MSCVSKLGEYLLSVLAFAKNMVNLVEKLDVAVWKAFLIWYEKITFGCVQPASKDSFDEDVGIITRATRE